ncbi:hypothetical protein DYGSA30_32810 [Dyella sp. GSA-30]|nr:hypothetical protein DYGSA30_32810 [Dyella sp. GSA-30]
MPATLSLLCQFRAMVCKRVHERIGRRIVGLPYIAQRPRCGREANKPIQCQFPAGFIEVKRARHLGMQNLVQLFCTLLNDETVAQDTRAMDDAVQTAESLSDIAHQLRHGITIAHVELAILCDYSQRLEFAEPGLHGRRQRRAPRQNQCCALGLARNVVREDQAQATGTTGDQVNPTILPGQRDIGRWLMFDPAGYFAPTIDVTHLGRWVVAIISQRLHHILARFDMDYLANDARIFQPRRTQHTAKPRHDLCLAQAWNDDLDQVLPRQLAQ